MWQHLERLLKRETCYDVGIQGENEKKKTEKRPECSIFDNIACPSSTLMYISVTPTNCLKGEHERRGVGERKGDGRLCQWTA